MNRLIVAVALVLTGCFIVPATKQTTKHLGTKDSGLIEGAVEQTSLAIEGSEAQLTIRATHRRACERRVFAVTETTTTRHARLGGSSDPRGRAFGFLISPLTIPISAAITGLMVASHGTKVERATTLQQVTKLGCTTVATRLPIELVLASGRTIRGVTDERGMVTLWIPTSEPYQGTVIARAGQATATTTYERPRPAMAVLRDTTRTCAKRHEIIGLLTLRVTVDTRGAPLQIATDRGPGELATCIGSAIAKLRFPDEQREATLVLALQIETEP